MTERYLLTSALPYANGPLHFGHIAGAYLPGDIFSRYARLAGHEVLFICGTDEYGAAIAIAAEQAGHSPKEHVDHFHGVIRRFFETLNIGFDHFSRTTNPYHLPIVQGFFRALETKGFLTTQTSPRQYCPSCRRFLPDRYVVGECYLCGHLEARGDECPKCGAFLDETRLKNARCKLQGHPTELRETSHWFLRLDLLRDKLKAWLETKRAFWKSNVLANVTATLESIPPRAITRDLDWGIPIPSPNSEGKVIYVWFDAPIGYVSATAEWAAARGTPEAWRDWWLNPSTRLIHFIGKDNITFHCITWPGMLIEQDQPFVLPHDVPANEFYNLEGRKFNKSEGWSIDTERFLATYPADFIRWTIARGAPETKDSEFTWSDFQARVNAELNDTFGNFVTRVLRGFVLQKYGGIVPDAVGGLREEDRAVLARARELHAEAGEAFARFEVRRATDKAQELGFIANRYIEATAPWKTLKAEPERCATTINVGVRLVELLALTIYPVIPASACRFWAAAGRQDAITSERWGAPRDLDPAGRRIDAFENPFRKITNDEVAAEVVALHARLAKHQAQEQKPVSEPVKQTETPAVKAPETPAAAPKPEPKPIEKTADGPKGEIAYEDFAKLDIRVALVKAAKAVVGADRLLELTLDMGTETRTVVSGIREHYAPEALVGRQVIYLANLKPRKLKGVLSHGMVLAANDGAAVLLKAERDCPPGSVIS